jgi:biotin carboxylase
MSHLLLLDVPGGNDFAVLEDAVAQGHEVTFLTADLESYRRQGKITQQALALAREWLEVPDLTFAAVTAITDRIHRTHPFQAILCLVDIRLTIASMLAQRYGLRFIQPDTAQLLRDKYRVRQTLAAAGIRQPRFALVEHADELPTALATVGYPALVKPTDGYASQNVSLLQNEDDAAAFLASALSSPQDYDYGFGVRANRRWSVEQYMAGTVIGCDVFCRDGEQVLLGINDKRMYPPPSFAIRGSCFPSSRHDSKLIFDYACEILDAVGFDQGAAHIEMIMSHGIPWLVEINPRLVSAHIPFQMGYAFERSIYAELIDLHLGEPIDALRQRQAPWFCAIRWLVADTAGQITTLALAQETDPNVRRIVLFKQVGDQVRPPLNNGDRIAYVMAVGKSQEEAERIAEAFWADCTLKID